MVICITIYRCILIESGEPQPLAATAGMARISTTRQRTREAAAELVAAGKRPHEITVDLVYERIRQGSRTTINDALKAWKAERTKSDALDAALPPLVADSMRSLWTTALEQGERTFDQQRTALEAQASAATEQADQLRRERDEQAAVAARLQQEIETLRNERDEARQQLAAESAARAEATEQLRVLREDLRRSHEEANAQIEILHRDLDARTHEYQQALEARDAAFRAELDTTTQRLASAQDQMLQQIDDARTAQRRAEAKAAEAAQRASTVAETLAAVRMQLVGEQQALAHERRVSASLTDDLARLQRELTIEKDAHAELRGRQATQTEQLGAWEGRARAAEQSLLAALASNTKRTRARQPASPERR